MEHKVYLDSEGDYWYFNETCFVIRLNWEMIVNEVKYGRLSAIYPSAYDDMKVYECVLIAEANTFEELNSLIRMEQLLEN